MDKYTQRIRLVFLGTFVILCLQYAYAIIVEEAYPSVVMPAFARANITNNQTTYSSIYFQPQGSDLSYTIADIFPGFSQAGARQLLDQAFFTTETGADQLTRKDKLVIRFLGRSFYERIVAPLKPTENKVPTTYPDFEQWLCLQAARATGRDTPTAVYLHQVRIIQDMTEKNILQQDTLSTYVIDCTHAE